MHRPVADRDAVVLVDTIGELSAVWGLADVAFVGGSLDGKRGGQNMIEPAAYGAAVVFGPQSDDVSQGRWPDGDRGGFYFFTRPTPGISNVLPTSRYAPVLGRFGDKSVALGSPLRFQVSATDADGPPRLKKS